MNDSIRLFPRLLIMWVLSLACLMNMDLQGQSNIHITGVVKGANDDLLMGNVLLISRYDSSLIKGAYYIDGIIEIEASLKTAADLRITSMGYMDTTLFIESHGGRYDLGALYLKENPHALEGATVQANRPLIEHSTDGTTTAYVQNTLLASSANLDELLAKLPYLIADDNRIIVLGKGEPVYYLDGKRVSQHQLQSIQINQIARIEIISNPSAKYDAQGKAVINIVTAVNTLEGIQGTLTQNTTQARYLKSYTNLNLNWRKGKWALLADYGFDLGRNWGTNLLDRETTTNGATSYFTNDYETNSRSVYAAKYRIGSSYKINSKSKISLEFLGSQNIWDQDSRATTVFTDALAAETTIDANTGGTNRNLSSAINANYNSTLDSLGSYLFIGAQYSAFSSDDESIIDELIDDGTSITSASRLNESGSSINFITGQIDLVKQFIKGLRLDLGSKITYAGNTGFVDFYSKSDDQPDYVYYQTLSNDFEYTEYIPAAYVQLHKSYDNKISLNFGIRGEYTNAKGNSISLSQTVIDTSYFNLFPNASIQIPLSKLFSLGVSYSSSINRPSYQALDPFLYYIDSLTSTQGNPELQPEYSHSIETSLSLKQYTLTMGYTYSRGALRYAMFEGENGPNSTILRQFNIQKEHSYYTSVTLPFRYKKFRSANVLGLTLDKIQDNRVEFATNEFVPRVYLHTRNSLLIDKVGKIELNAQYLGTRFDGIYYRKPAYMITTGISRSFFKEKLNCSFTVSDFLRTFEVDGYYELAVSKVSYVRRFDTYFYRLSLSYTFGKLNEVNYSTRNVGQDAESRILMRSPL